MSGSSDTPPNGAELRPRPPARWRLVRWPGLTVIMLFLVALVHYWPGRGWLTYIGCNMRPIEFDLDAPGRYPLATPRSDVPGVANFAQISEQLYRGAQPTREGFIELQKMGLKTIVNLRETRSDRGGMEGLGLRYVHIRFNPAGPEDAEIAAFMQVMQDPDCRPAFVHCLAGSDRTGTIVAIYRVMEQDWPMEEAVKELPRFGYHDVWTDLLLYLADFDPSRVTRLMSTQPPPRIDVVP
jgi:tyrosine-protein phosphatase SIW14